MKTPPLSDIRAQRLSLTLVVCAFMAPFSSAVSTVGDVSAGDLPVAFANEGPAFITRPESQTVFLGGTLTLTAISSGDPTPTYQWRKNGEILLGQTNSTLIISNLKESDAGDYTNTALNPGGTALSAAATITVVPAPFGPFSRIVNASVRTTLVAQQTLIVGFVVSGGTKPILVRAIGPTLARFDVANAMPHPSLALIKNGVQLDANAGWGGGVALSTTFASTGAFALGADSLDAAIVRPLNGAHSALVSDTVGGNVLVELYDAGTGLSPRLTNFSARNRVGTGGDILIAGISIDGTAPQNVLVRAIGPTLTSFGVPGALSDPQLTVYAAGGVKMAENDNWSPPLATTFTTAGAFTLPTNSKDSALALSLAPGSYTLHVSGVQGGTGEALVEVYELP